MVVLKFIIWLILLIIIVAASLQNMQAVELKYYIINLENFRFELKKTGSIQLFIVLIGSLFSGFLLASLFGMVNSIRLKSIIWKQKKTIKDLDKKNEKLTFSITRPSDEQG